jgi:hypothetical protein
MIQQSVQEMGPTLPDSSKPTARQYTQVWHPPSITNQWALCCLPWSPPFSDRGTVCASSRLGCRVRGWCSVLHMLRHESYWCTKSSHITARMDLLIRSRSLRDRVCRRHLFPRTATLCWLMPFGPGLIVHWRITVRTRPWLYSSYYGMC